MSKNHKLSLQSRTIYATTPLSSSISDVLQPNTSSPPSLPSEHVNNHPMIIRTKAKIHKPKTYLVALTPITSAQAIADPL